ARSQLARARGLGHVRDRLSRASGPEAHPHVRGVQRPPLAQRLSRQEAPATDRAGQLAMPPELNETSHSAADLETRDMLLSSGPAHPAMHGIIRILAKLDGERIEYAEVEIGYLHRGFEKMAETVDYNGVIPYTDRLNYVSPLINNMGYC